jgi:hypothetical protein
MAEIMLRKRETSASWEGKALKNDVDDDASVTKLLEIYYFIKNFVPEREHGSLQA